MRKLIVANLMSLDGYIAGPGGALFSRTGHLLLPMDDAVFNTYNLARAREADTLLFGRITFEMFQAHWPKSTNDPDPIQREIAGINNSLHRMVVSDTLHHGPDDDWSDAEIVRRANAHARIAELKAGPGRDILMFGSHVLWNDLLAAGLVDELHMMVGAVLLGEGVPAFETTAHRSLRLADTLTFADSSTIVLKYEPA